MTQLNDKDKLYKEFRKLQVELNKLYELRYNQPKIKLDEPYQKGWIIYYDLRDDIKKRDDSSRILRAIQLGYSNQTTRSVAHVRNVRSGLTVKSPLYPGLRERELKKIPEDLQKYFIKSYRYAQSKYWTQHNFYEICIPKYWLVRKVKPNMITHVVDNLLEQEITKLRTQIYESDKYVSFTKRDQHSFCSYNKAKERGHNQKIKSHVRNYNFDEIFNEKFPPKDKWYE